MKLREYRKLAPVHVKAGVEFLDKHQPGWREKVNLEVLDMQKGFYCILGQVFGSYHDGASFIERTVGRDKAIDFRIGHGFQTPRELRWYEGREGLTPKEVTKALTILKNNWIAEF